MEEIAVRECVTVEEFDRCVKLQREVFGLPDLEISPRRHLIVSREAGGWTLGAFADDGLLVGFVHHLVALRNGSEVIGYSHMMAVHKDFQNKGVGARLKWAQRERALDEGRRFIRWTWDPMQARNAHFNLNRLGVVARAYGENFYGSDYVTDAELKSVSTIGLPSDRLLASWDLSSVRVVGLADGTPKPPLPDPIAKIEIPTDWNALLKQDLNAAKSEQSKVRSQFAQAFSTGLVCAGFDRTSARPCYLLYNSHEL